MRIAQMNLQSGWGGGEALALLLGRELAARGAEVSFGCLPQSALAGRARASGFTTWHFTSRTQFSLTGALRLARYLRVLRPDVLHLHSAREYFVGALGGRLARVPCIVLTRHMALPAKAPMKPVYNVLCHRVACVSRAVQDELTRSGVHRGRTLVIYGAIDQTALRAKLQGREVAKVRLNFDPKKPLVGSIGSLLPAKGGADFLHAARLLCSDGFDGNFVMAGDGPQRGELENLARELKLETRVRFPGFVPEVADVLSALDAFVLATRESEALGLVLVEAMTARVPVVATNPRGGVSELVEHESTGLLTPPCEPAALAASLARLLKNAALRETLVENAAFKAAHFDAPRMADEYEMLYREVLAQR